MEYRLVSCVWELTRACNLRCIHCGSTSGKKRDNELDLDEALKLCDELKKAGCLSVALMGGEPFLSPNFKKVASYIRELGMELSVITNGTLWDEDILSFLKDLSPRAVATSIDGADSKTHDFIRGVPGSFKKTYLFIEKALEYDLPVSVITSVSKLNISELDGIARMLKGKKIAWQVQIVGAEGGRFPKEYLLDEDEFYAVGVFLEVTRRRYSVLELPFIGAHDMGYNSCFIKNIWLYDRWVGCQAGISVCGIRSNGDVLGCLSINDDRFVEGNVREKGFYQIWSCESSFTYNRRFLQDNAGGNCKDCRYLKECKGGCCEMSLMKTGMMHNDPYCFYRYERKNLSFFERLNLSLSSFFWRKVDKERLRAVFLGFRG